MCFLMFFIICSLRLTIIAAKCETDITLTKCMYDKKSVRSVESQISLGFNFVQHDTSHRSPYEETSQSEPSIVCPTEGLTVTLLMFTEGDLSHVQTPQQWRPLAIILPSENTTATGFQMSGNLPGLFSVVSYPVTVVFSREG